LQLQGPALRCGKGFCDVLTKPFRIRDQTVILPDRITIGPMFMLASSAGYIKIDFFIDDDRRDRARLLIYANSSRCCAVRCGAKHARCHQPP
jgi:hypothetical protein